MLKDRILAEPGSDTMKKDPRIFVHHILESIGLIEGLLGWKDLGGLYNLNISARYDYPEN